MPKISKATADHSDHGPVEEWRGESHGYSIEIIAFHQDIDSTPLLKGLPGDRCQCPHWGYVLKGKVTFSFADHDEVFEAGDAFYVPPGHGIMVAGGSEYVQFSPADELRPVEETIMRNFQAMMQHA